MTAYTRLDQLRESDRIARSFAESAARTLRQDAQTAISDTVRALDKLRECGVSTNYLDDTLAKLLDEGANLQHEINTGLAGADPFHEGLDLGEVLALLMKVRKP